MQLDEFLKQVCPQLELDWRKYRRASQRKVMARIRELELQGLEEYARYIQDHPREGQEVLPNILRVTVSRFFREQQIWDHLAGYVLPRVVSIVGASRPVRILSIGCCNGEEPYSAALTWKWGMGDRPDIPKPHITALDVDPSCLGRARMGLYTAKTLREVPPHLRSKWFAPETSGYRLDPGIRNMVSFVHRDILQDPLPEAQDIIFCRYLVFTYFHGRRRRLMLEKILNSLAPHGYVILGRKEGLHPDDEAFLQPVSGMPGLYISSPLIHSGEPQPPGRCPNRSACGR